MLIELLVVVMNAIKETAKKILNENVEVINTNGYQGYYTLTAINNEDIYK